MTQPEQATSRLATAWMQAAAPLGIEVVAPHSVTLPSGARIDAVALVKSFGGAKGMLVLADYGQVRHHVQEVVVAGYGFSVMSEPAPERPPTLDGWREVLRDWGWSGPPGQEPLWLATTPDRTPPTL